MLPQASSWPLINLKAALNKGLNTFTENRGKRLKNGYDISLEEKEKF